ncbi:hypothetical protein [Photobacterium phosphoreum]|uniref:hypothetical protein n=1 Tax=Photobacterium phosphoreum TaxID=659 RepID=UPI001E5687BE|nr:hypothetical protein [Photobacterium phosphoreum]MCD9472917.1 hypothetical protein [Photobacterium phosphoreum]
MFIERKEDFREWLIEQKGISRRVAGNIISRCKRLDEEVLGSIDLSVSSVDNYLSALSMIKSYSLANKSKDSAKYAMSASLRAAIRKYCEYRNPDDILRFPNAYHL